MDAAGYFLGAQHGDGALDLAPAAEMDHVAERPAAIGALGRLELGEIAIMRDEVAGFRKRLAILDMNMIVQTRRPIYSLVDTCLALPPFPIGASPS